MSRKERNNNSLWTKSMKIAVDIIRQSSLSIAQTSLGTSGPPVSMKNFAPVTGSVVASKETLLSQVSGGRRLQEPQSSSKPISFMMQPDEGNGSSYVTHEESNMIDGKASAYIKKVHARYHNDALEAPMLAPYLLPLPSRALK
uniref:Uncharacterized protein n=1 Tax=Rhizophora mucronata TaxID=61149 RepID=A0A2P2NFM3_RHIMU